MLKTTALLLLFICSFIANSSGQDILFALPRLGVNSTTNINGYYYSVWQERFYAKSFTAFRGVYKSNGTFPKSDKM